MPPTVETRSLPLDVAAVNPSTGLVGPSRLLVADVGGTHARLAWACQDARGRLLLQGYQQFDCAAHSGLGAILRAFVHGDSSSVPQDGPPLRAVVAIAGVVQGDVLRNSNLAWPVALEATRIEAGLAALELLNDFEATAWAVEALDDAAGLLLCGPADAPAEGPALILGPGTGLGAALYIPASARAPAHVLASEAGHASLAAATPREIALLQELQRDRPMVNYEALLSGPGLCASYRALCVIDGVVPRWESAGQISAAAATGDAQAAEVLHLFCAMLGSFAGDLAMTFRARRVYLAGGIPARIAPLLQHSDFARRFTGKVGLQAVLEQVPVRLVEHGQLGLIGAYGYACASRAAMPPVVAR